MKNTDNIDFEHVKRLVDNGKALMDEAEILLKYQKNRRSFFLYFTAYEQFYKARLILEKKDPNISHAKTLVDLNNAIAKALLDPKLKGKLKLDIVGIRNACLYEDKTRNHNYGMMEQLITNETLNGFCYYLLKPQIDLIYKIHEGIEQLKFLDPPPASFSIAIKP